MTMVKRLLTAWVLSVALIAVGSPVRAQQAAGPCKTDIEKLCAKVERGHGRVVMCLKEHTAELSPECKKVIDDWGQRSGRKQEGRRGAGMRGVCNAEIEKYCKAAIGKRNEMAACLKGHESDLSAECKAKVEQVLKRIEANKVGGEKT